MTLRQQAAMEYLTTYGWAVVVIGVVLGALYSFGLFALKPNVGGSCLAVSGFSCTKPVFYSSGVVVAGFGLIGRTVTVTETACTVNSTLTGATFLLIWITALSFPGKSPNCHSGARSLRALRQGQSSTATSG